MRLRAAVAGAAMLLVVAKSAAAAPALWVVRDTDSTLYIFGTMHALKPGIAWRSAQINRAFADSDELILEVVASNDPAKAQALARTYGFDPTGSLSSKLDPSDRERLAAAVEGLGAPPEALERMRPWLAAVTLAAAPMIRQGWLPANGVEAVLTADAQATKKPISGLETPDQQIRMLADIPENIQIAALRAVLGGSDEGLGKLEALAAAWAAGDLSRLERGAADLRTGRDLMVDDATRVQRNQVWAEEIQRKLAGSGTSFIAVGAGHLLGPDSVQEALASRGVTTERLD